MLPAVLVGLLAAAPSVLASQPARLRKAAAADPLSAAPAAGGRSRGAVAASPTVAVAAGAAVTPLTAQRWPWPFKGPNHIDSSTAGRGAMTGDNVCNMVPGQFNQTSRCVISHMNSVEDFCLWAPPDPNSAVADQEGHMIAWCSQPGYGTRLIPPGAISGVQFVRTPDYVAIAGYVDQTQLNIAAGDTGGEMDSHGADRRGNPLGGLMYSTAFSASGNTSTATNANSSGFVQASEWHSFMGGGMFCQKACNPGPNAAKLCEHIYDRLGCLYNVPLSYNTINGTFQSCLGEDQLPPGQFVVGNVTSTYTQPPESLGAITSVPYTPVVPPTSSCTTYQPTAIWSAAFAAYSSSSPAAAASASARLPAASNVPGLGSSVPVLAASASPTTSRGAADRSLAAPWQALPVLAIAASLLFGAAAVAL